jgi:peroxiredoxin
MKTSIALLLTLTLFSFTDDSLSLLKKAQSKISDHAFLRYDYTLLWPNPEGMVDTLMGTASFSKHANRYYDYDYIKTENGGTDLVYINDELKQIDHSDSVLVFYTESDLLKEKQIITGNSIVKRSPIALLSKKDWIYKNDTVLSENQYSVYKTIETDTLINTNKIDVEWYVYINKAAATLDRYERRAFFNGKSSQIIVYSFHNYAFEKARKQLTYHLPAGYRTQLGVKKEKWTLLKEGQTAPVFSATDLQGKEVNLQNLRGKKTLLVFSTINCGYCKMALDHFNRKGYQLKDDLNGAYIFPEDKVERLTVYATKVKIPWPVLPAAQQTGKEYGVTGYPTFFLLNEHGVIEKVVAGYNEQFIESLRK